MYKAIVIGVSMGGLEALTEITQNLPRDLDVSVIIVQHMSQDKKNRLVEILKNICPLNVEEAREKHQIEKKTVYIAPPGYHLLVDEDGTFCLDEGDYVSFSRPSIDVLFESAANYYRSSLIGVILTGANRDGSEGIKKVKECGGYTIVQDPDTAVSSEMVNAALESTEIDKVLKLDEIAQYLAFFTGSG